MYEGGGRSYHRGGSGGGGGRRGRGRGRGGPGRGRGYRHQPYNNRSRGGGGGGGGGQRPSNRFGGSQAAQDPQTAMIRQVSSFVSRVGEFKNITKETPKEDTGLGLNAVEATTAGNINDLVLVLCSEDKLDMLFRYQQEVQPKVEEGNDNTTRPTQLPASKAEEKVGKLGHLVVSCAAGLPLQTPCYAALTLAVHEQIKESQWTGFAARCVGYAMDNVARDLDEILSTGKNVAHGCCRIKLLLRYLAILGKMGVVQGFQSEQAADPNKLTIFGLLSTLVEAAKIAKQRNAAVITHLLAYLVLSTLPYVMGYVPQESINEWILKPIESLFEDYKSAFTPGLGRTSILLKDEQDDGDANIEEEDDEEDEEEDDDSSGQVCDSLQDLLRVSRKFREPTRFALPIDSPWKGLVRRGNFNPETGETETVPIAFTDDPLYLSVNNCGSLKLLLTGEGNFPLLPFTLDGVVFGRLPIFGPPPDPDDDGDDEEETEEDAAAKNENLLAFKSGFSLLDRFFVSETLRDCLISHESFVSPTGLQQGTAKDVAEELLSVRHVFSGENPSKGLEYAIVETLFALVAQCREESNVKHTSISRILLELTRLHPQLFSPSLAVAMTNLFEDYLPALVPTARDNFSRWFAFHLINTDYQWPSAFWELWQPYALSPQQSSRGDFVRRALHVMVENVSNPSVVLNECIPHSKSLSAEFFPRTSATLGKYVEGSPMHILDGEINKRIWDQNDDPALLLDFLLGEEVSSAIATVEGSWLRSQALIRVLVSPASKIFDSLNDDLNASDKGDDDMVDDTAQSKDFYMSICDGLVKYSSTLTGVLTTEAEAHGDITQGGAIVLRQVEAMAYFNVSILQGIVSHLIDLSVVNGVSVARWALGDLGESSPGYIISRWWIFALDALRQGTSSSMGSGGMVVDGSAAESSFIASRNEMMKYLVPRVCMLLATKNEKRLDPMQVYLVEGMKTVASSCHVADEARRGKHFSSS